MLRAAPAAPAAGCFRARFPKRFVAPAQHAGHAQRCVEGASPGTIRGDLETESRNNQESSKERFWQVISYRKARGHLKILKCLVIIREKALLLGCKRKVATSMKPRTQQSGTCIWFTSAASGEYNNSYIIGLSIHTAVNFPYSNTTCTIKTRPYFTTRPLFNKPGQRSPKRVSLSDH